MRNAMGMWTRIFTKGARTVPAVRTRRFDLVGE
jgi:hypothetical protein